MNNLIVKMLQSPDKLERIRKKLPPAFEMVEQQAGGPAMGTLREGVLIGMLMAFLGEEQVKPSTSAVEADVDCYVGDGALSIKTVKDSGEIRVKWTVDQEKVREFMESFAPECDLLITRIRWGKNGRISYIPLEVQQQVFAQLGSNYLAYRPGTNTRGVNLSKNALAALEKSSSSLIVPLKWYKSIEQQSLYDRWVSYWQTD